MHVPKLIELQRRMPQRPFDPPGDPPPPPGQGRDELMAGDLLAIRDWRARVLEAAAVIAELGALRAGSRKLIAKEIRKQKEKP